MSREMPQQRVIDRPEPTIWEMIVDARNRVLAAAQTIRTRRAYWTDRVIRERGRMDRVARRLHGQTHVEDVVDQRMVADPKAKLAAIEDELYSRRALMLAQTELLREFRQTNRLLADQNKLLTRLASQLSSDVTNR